MRGFNIPTAICIQTAGLFKEQGEGMAKEARDTKEVQIHIMHSMKGGCGKSTCALFKALQLACARDMSDETAHVLYLDADFKGSAMMEILFRLSQTDEVIARKEKEIFDALQESAKKNINAANIKTAPGSLMQHIFAVPGNFDENKTISNYLKDSSQLCVKDIILHSCSYAKNVKPDESAEDASGVRDDKETDKSLNGFIDFILASTSPASKDWFRYGTGKINAGIYTYRMKSLLHKLLKIGCVNDESIGDYSHIVVDMPPGYDEYSEILLDILRELAAENRKVKLNYYGITTEDRGHKKLTEDNLRRLNGEATGYKPLDTINLVLNSISTADFKDISEEDKRIYQAWLPHGEETTGKVYRCEYDSNYHSYCRDAHENGMAINLENVLKELTWSE